jgi:hypothetical protein
MIWESRTSGKPVIEAIFQTDGNLVLYGPNNNDGSADPLWASNTGGHQGDRLSFGSDGVWIYDVFNNPIWHNGSRV